MFQLRTLAAAVAGVLTLGPSAQPAAAQTDFHNLDKGRPLRVEDAYAAKRGAFELQASPLTVAGRAEGEMVFFPSVELKYGFLPGMEFSAGVEGEFPRRPGDGRSASAEAEFSVLANLWVESHHLPAAALRFTTHLPTAVDHGTSAEFRGILTRWLAGPVRWHLNGALVVGEGRRERWWGGGALDWVFPFHHTLALAEVWVAEGVEGERRIHSAMGVRLQATPTLVLDAGMGRSWRGESWEDWAGTLGITHEFGVRRLLPGGNP